jgi:hypothetical protein
VEGSAPDGVSDVDLGNLVEEVSDFGGVVGEDGGTELLGFWGDVGTLRVGKQKERERRKARKEGGKGKERKGKEKKG